MQAVGEGELVVIERFVQVCVLAAEFAVRGARNGREFRQHDTQTQLVGEAHGVFQPLPVSERMPGNQVTAKPGRAESGFFEEGRGPFQFVGVDLSAGLTLPLALAAFETQVDVLEPCLGHEFGNSGRDEPGIERIGRVKRQVNAAAKHSFKERKQGVFRLEEEGVVVENGVLDATSDQELQVVLKTDSDRES